MIDEAIDKVAILFQGKVPEKIDTRKIADESQHKFAEMLNQLIDYMEEIHDFIIPLSQGEILKIKISPKNFLASPFKELHSHLLHLTWQAKQVAHGDYSQRVDFMGEFSEAFNFMIVSLDYRERQLKTKIDELENANSYIRNLEGFLPICSNCKKIRLKETDPKKQENWVDVEDFFGQETKAQFSHSICPKCMKNLYPEYTEEDE